MLQLLSSGQSIDNKAIFYILPAGLINDRSCLRIMIYHIGNDGILQTSGNQNGIPGITDNIIDLYCVGIPQRRYPAPSFIIVADFDGCCIPVAGRGSIDHSVTDNIVDFYPSCIEKTDDMVFANAISANITDGDIANIVIGNLFICTSLVPF